MNLGQTGNKRSVVIKEYRLDSASVQVYDNYLVTTFDEGATLTMESVYQIIGVSEVHFRDRTFGYICYRKNSHSVNPMIYNYVAQLENLKAFAIVSIKGIDMYNYRIEQMFYKQNMEFFVDYNNAVSWIKTELTPSHNGRSEVNGS